MEVIFSKLLLVDIVSSLVASTATATNRQSDVYALNHKSSYHFSSSHNSANSGSMGWDTSGSSLQSFSGRGSSNFGSTSGSTSSQSSSTSSESGSGDTPQSSSSPDFPPANPSSSMTGSKTTIRPHQHRTQTLLVQIPIPQKSTLLMATQVTLTRVRLREQMTVKLEFMIQRLHVPELIMRTTVLLDIRINT
jgi:hypothetical protein